MPKIKKFEVRLSSELTGQNNYVKEYGIFVNSKGEFYTKLDEAIIPFVEEYLNNYSKFNGGADKSETIMYQKDVKRPYSPNPVVTHLLYGEDVACLEKLLKGIEKFSFSGEEKRELIIRYQYIREGKFYIQKDGSITGYCCEKRCRYECESGNSPVQLDPSPYSGSNNKAMVGIKADIAWKVSIIPTIGETRFNYYPTGEFPIEDPATDSLIKNFNSWPYGWSGWNGYPKGETNSREVRKEWESVEFTVERAEWFLKQFEALARIGHYLEEIFDPEMIIENIDGRIGLLPSTTESKQ